MIDDATSVILVLHQEKLLTRELLPTIVEAHERNKRMLARVATFADFEAARDVVQRQEDDERERKVADIAAEDERRKAEWSP
jgi:hypothetical protein